MLKSQQAEPRNGHFSWICNKLPIEVNLPRIYLYILYQVMDVIHYKKVLQISYCTPSSSKHFLMTGYWRSSSQSLEFFQELMGSIKFCSPVKCVRKFV